jgi:hypothetical protein
MENASSNASDFAKKRLQEASRAKHSATVMAVTLSTAAVGLVVLLFFALLDYWLMLVPSVRYGGLLAMCVLVGGGVYKLVKALKRPTPLKEAALDAEAIKPDLGCELSTAAEYLSGERKPNQQYEGELAAALQENAAQQLQKVQLPYWERMIRPALIVAVLVLAAVFFSVLASGGMTAFKRAAMPWTNARYTEVEVKPGDVEIPVGRDLEVKSVFSGRIPRQPKFQWQDEGNPKWQFAALTRNEQGEYTYPLKNVRNSLKYRVSGSDALSSEFTIQPYTPPDVKEWNVELEFPSYTRLPKAKQNTPEMTVLRGTVASIQIAPTTKLSKAQLRFKEGPAVDLHPVENGFWKTDLKISADAEFTIELADEKGRADSNENIYQIKALPDEVPKVEIAEPGQDTTAAATNTVAVKISAMDDYGINELKLVYHRLGGPEEFVVAKRNGETNTEFTAEIPLSPLGLKEYELVAYHALAIDNNTLDGPGIGKSEVYFIEITDKEGGACKSQGKGQKVNLLVIQKQIIADTVALGSNPEAAKMEDLAKRQKDAVEFGRMYEKAISMTGSNSAASQEISAAIADMEKAQASLEQQHAKLALPSEESALARLYQIVGMMPELQDMPTVPPPPPEEKKEEEEKPPTLQVVLEEIKKKKEEEPDNQELAEALEEAKRLQEEQASLSLGIQPSEGNGKPPQGGGGGETDIDRSGKKPTSAEAKAQEKKLAAAKAKAQAEKKGKKGQAGKGKPKKGEGKGEKGGEGKGGKGEAAKKESDKAKAGAKPGEKAGEPGEEKSAEDPAKEESEEKPEEQPNDELAQKEEELSEDTKALAEKLERMAGKDNRIGHGVPKKVKEAGNKMGEAASAMSRGETETAGVHGAQAGAALQAAVVMLENTLLGRSQRVDVSKEEAPKQYEALISEYFKALSYDN